MGPGDAAAMEEHTRGHLAVPHHELTVPLVTSSEQCVGDRLRRDLFGVGTPAR
jgi:hypothetical protein